MNRAKLPKNGFDFKDKITPGKGLPGRFIFPPFTVLRATDGEWNVRKRQWISLGIKSEVGRGGNLTIRDPQLNDFNVYKHGKYKRKAATTYNIGNKTEWEKGLLHKGKTINTSTEKWDGGESAWQNSGTSIFDPVLCELMYSWFCPIEGQVIDPFAGGSVRGIVATFMGYKYWGSELRQEQVDENVLQGKSICNGKEPVWICGDSYECVKEAPQSDFLFSCPPYGNLEVYSELDADISNMNYDAFIDRYTIIIRRFVRRLKENRFACFVVGNFRDKKTGIYHNFVGDTIKAFKLAGMDFYNDAILITPTGSLPVRAGRQFNVSRKLGKAHQNILVFYKGNPKEINKIFNHE
jgi:hypothetical protein